MSAHTAALPGRPVLAALHVPAVSVLLKTPPDVPAYRVADVVGSMMTVRKSASPGRPEFAGLQVVPPSALLNRVTGASVPA